MLHTWSLSVEEQFYLFFPVVAIFALRRSFKFFIKLLFIFCLLSLALSQWAALLKPISAFYLLWARLWEFLIGSLIAVNLDKSEKWTNPNIASLGSWLGLLMIGYAVFAFDRQTVFLGLNAMLPTLGAACIIIFASEKNHVGKLLSIKPLATIGLISYSAYLWHQPLYAFVRHSVDYDLSPAFYLILIALTLGLSYLSWRHVEQPFRQPHRTSFRRVLLLCVIADALLLGFGLAGKVANGMMDRPNLVTRFPQSVGHVDFYETLSTYPVCLPHEIAKSAVVYEDIARCRQSKADALPTFVLIGDSHAEHLFFGLSEQLQSENVAVFLNRTFPFHSEKDFSNIYNYLLGAPSVHTVVIGVQWTRWFSTQQASGSLHEELLQTIRPLQESGKRVFLMGDIPMFPFSAERCKYKLQHTVDDICAIPLEKVVMHQNEFMRELLLVVQNMPQVELLSVRELLCTSDQCSMSNGNGLMYRDESHLNVDGSRYVISELIKKHPSLAGK